MGIFEIMTGKEESNEPSKPTVYSKLEDIPEEGALYFKSGLNMSVKGIRTLIKTGHMKLPFEAWHIMPLSKSDIVYKPRGNKYQHPFQKFKGGK